MKKKYISLFLALVMVIGLAVPTTLAAETGLYDDLMATGHIVEFESAYNSANAEAKNALTTQQITGIYNYLNDLYIDPSAASLLAKRDSLNSAILALPNAPELCSECGTLGGHTGGCALTPTPAPTQEPTPTPEVTEPTPTPEAGEPTPEPTPEVTPEPVPTAFEQIMAGATTEEMLITMNGLLETDMDGILALTFEEIEAIQAQALALDPEKTSGDTNDLLANLSLLPNSMAKIGCPGCGQMDAHAEDCPWVLGGTFANNVHNVTLNKWYDTLSAATAAAADGNVIEVYNNITETQSVKIQKQNLTIRAAAGKNVTVRWTNTTYIGMSPFTHYACVVIYTGVTTSTTFGGGTGTLTFDASLASDNDNKGTRARVMAHCGKGALNIKDGIVLTGGNTGGGDYYSDGSSSRPAGSGEIAGTSGFGSGILMYYGTLNMTGGIIKDNYSQWGRSSDVAGNTDHWLVGGGGGVYLSAGTVMNMSGGTITHNASGSGGGGGILVGGGSTLNLSGGNITYNVSRIASGGGIGVQIGSVVTITGGYIAYNEVKGHGGGLFARGDSTPLKITGGTFEHNYAGSYGGAILFWTVGDDITKNAIEISGNTIIQNNEAGVNGGGVCVGREIDKITGLPIGSKAKLTISGSPVIKDNKALGEKGLGGGIYMQSDKFSTGVNTVVINGGTISGNSAYQGGGIYAPGGIVTMTGGTFSGNTATAEGGGIYTGGGTIDMSGGSFTGNIAGTNGGGAFVQAGNVTVSGGSITGNEATGNGGGMAIDGGSFTMISGTMTDNTAGSHGGGVYTKGGNITVGVVNCTGPEHGDKHSVTHTDKTHPIVNNNEAPFGGGLAVESTGTACNVYLYCGTIQTNESMNDGTGANVFMSGAGDTSQIHHYLDSTKIGSDDNHGIVVIGGKLDVVTSQQTYDIEIRYHPNYAGNDEIWKGTAPKDYMLNLPYCPADWEDAQNPPNTFVGWTYKKNATDDVSTLSFIRNKSDYKFLGDPIRVRDALPEAKVDNGVHYIDFYAVWAPLENTITYVAAYDNYGTVADTTGTLTGYAPKYDFSTTAATEPLVLENPSKPGYTFTGWKLNADTTIISNWNSDAPDYSVYNLVDGRGIDRAGNAWEYKDGKLTINMDRNFGYITLTAMFEENTATFVYEAIGPVGKEYGYLTPDGETVFEYKETIGAATGTPTPVTATANYGYKFDGWCLDYELANMAYTSTEAVGDKAKIEGAKITPEKNAQGIYVSEQFFALINYNLADLTITKTVTTANGLTNDYEDEQLFVFQVKDDEGTVISTITLAANESKVINDLYIGRTYTVTELTDWSWRYDLTTQNDVEVPIRPDPENTREVNVASFINELQTNQWLTEDSTVVNTYRAKQ